MDRIIFGDNQFFGVSHMSEERGIERAMRFQGDQAIVDVVDAAVEAGIEAFSFSTHERVGGLCARFRADRKKYGGMRFYATIPYAHKYADLVNEQGILGAVAEVLRTSGSAATVARMAGNVGAFVFRQNPRDLMRLLIDAELRMFRQLAVPVVFLQNIVADLILGLGWNVLLREFHDYVASAHGARAGFITTNLPRMVRALKDVGVERPLVCAAINRIGAQMSPDIDSYIQCLSRGGFDAVAMTFMAGGAVAPQEALEWLSRLPNVQAVIFGASSRHHINQTRDLIRAHLFRD